MSCFLSADSPKKSIMRGTASRNEQFKIELRKAKNAEIFARKRQLKLAVVSRGCGVSSLEECRAVLESEAAIALHKQCLKNLASLLFTPEAFTAQEIIDSGILSCLFNIYATSSHGHIVLAAGKLATNVIGGTNLGLSSTAANELALSVTRRLFSRDVEVEVVEAGIFALANLVADAPACREQLLALGFVAGFINALGAQLLQSGALLSHFVWLLSNLLQGVEKATPPAQEKEAIVSFLGEICRGDFLRKDVIDELSSDLSDLLLSTSRDRGFALALLTCCSVQDKLHKLLVNGRVCARVLRALSNLIGHAPDHALPLFVSSFYLGNYCFVLRQAPGTTVLADCFFNLSNLAVCAAAVPALLAHAPLFEDAAEFVLTKPDGVRKELFHFLGNLAYQFREELLEEFQRTRVIELLVQGLLVEHKATVALALDALGQLMHYVRGGGPAKAYLREKLLEGNWSGVQERLAAGGVSTAINVDFINAVLREP